MANKSNNTNVTTNTNGTTNTLIIEGEIVSAYVGGAKNDPEKLNRLAIKSDSIPYESITAFEGSKDRYIPAWFKDKTGYINLKSRYNIPVKDSKATQFQGLKGHTIDFAEFVERETVIGSKVRISIIQRDGALYPKALVVLEDGEPKDPFEGL